MEPYLEGGIRERFDAWHAALRARFERDLTFTEIRKGVQALSSLYVGRRGRLEGGAEALEGAGKRAGFALYYAPLHFIIAHHVVRETGFDEIPAGKLWDLGCGTGAGGAAWAASYREPGVKVIGVDRSGFALEEAAQTYRAFGVKAETRRMVLGEEDAGDGGVVKIGLPGRPARKVRERGALGKNDAILFAYALNEMTEAGRDRMLRDAAAGGGTSRPLLILEPVAKKIAPWWSRWEGSLGEEALSVHSFEWRKRLELPPWIAEMDAAAGLDHAELTARVLGFVG